MMIMRGEPEKMTADHRHQGSPSHRHYSTCAKWRGLTTEDKPLFVEQTGQENNGN